MKEISLTKGKVALVDDADYEFLSRFKWCAHAITNTFFASRRPTKLFKHELMHRAILSPIPKGLEVDHIDGNSLNNQKSNLRPCTRSQNQWNSRLNSNNTSGVKGVSWYKKRSLWVAHIGVLGKRKTLGYFDEKEAAALAYDNAARSLFGEFAKTNYGMTA